jgi:hypothetical protein
MNSFFGRMATMTDEIARGEARFWVNDFGVVLVGEVRYPDGIESLPVDDFVGLVDEQAGGMIAYGKAAQMQDLANALNAFHAIEHMLGGTHAPLPETSES